MARLARTSQNQTRTRSNPNCAIQIITNHWLKLSIKTECRIITHLHLIAGNVTPSSHCRCCPCLDGAENASSAASPSTRHLCSTALGHLQLRSLRSAKLKSFHNFSSGPSLGGFQPLGWLVAYQVEEIFRYDYFQKILSSFQLLFWFVLIMVAGRVYLDQGMMSCQNQTSSSRVSFFTKSPLQAEQTGINLRCPLIRVIGCIKVEHQEVKTNALMVDPPLVMSKNNRVRFIGTFFTAKQTTKSCWRGVRQNATSKKA